MKTLLPSALVFALMSGAAHANSITIVNEHPSASIVRLEVMNETSIGVRDFIEVDGGAISPGQRGRMPIDVGDGGCEYALIATFDDADETSIQARGVDVCEDPVWTLMDGDYRID